MVTAFDVNPNDLIKKTAEKLADVKEIVAPDWSKFVKTGRQKERPPHDINWWPTRTAAILRSIYMKGPIGVSKLRTKYGGKKKRNVKPGHFFKASGSITRKILQQLEKAGFVKYDEKGVHKGRKITAKGRSFLDNIAKEIAPVKKNE
jgi:small subunit ribosomal protein S19e